MQFKRGAEVFTADGKQVGRIDRVVLDPKNKEIIGVVVRKGLLFTEDKVVPAGLIATATEDRVTLREKTGNLDDLTDFEERHYVPLNQPSDGSTPMFAPPVFWYPPIGAAVPYPGFTGQPYVTETEQHIPQGTVALREGAPVVSFDDKNVGGVDRIITGPDGREVTHLIISEGTLVKTRKLIPITWVDDVMEDQVRLGVDADLIAGLPEYTGDQAG